MSDNQQKIMSDEEEKRMSNPGPPGQPRPEELPPPYPYPLNQQGSAPHYSQQQPPQPVLVVQNVGYGGGGFIGGPVVGRVPVAMTCPNCHHGIVTNIITEPSTLAWVAAIVMCAVGCFCCSFIPFLMPDCQRHVHTCPNCHRVVGIADNNRI